MWDNPNKAMMLMLRSGLSKGASLLAVVFLASCVVGTLTLADTLTLNDIVIAGNIDPMLYVTLGKSLASGLGYRDIALVGNPASAHFPPGLPLLLSLVFATSPSFPENALLLTGVSLVCGILAIAVCTALLWKIDAGEHSEIVFWTMAITVVSPYIIVYSSQHVLSEMPYLLFSTLAMLLLHVAEKSSGSARVLKFLLASLAIAVSYYMRTAGLALFVAAVALMLLRKQWREAVLLTGVVGLLLLPWTIRNQLLDHSSVFSDYGSAFLWREFANSEAGLIQSWWEIPIRLLRNIAGHVTSTVPQVLLPSFRTNGFFWRFSVQVNELVQPLTGVGLAALIGVGYLRRVTTRLSILEFYVLFYVALILMPPWVTDRNLVPILPFLIYYCLLGVWYGAQRLATMHSRAVVAIFGSFLLLTVLVTSRHNVALALDQRGNSPQTSLAEAAAVEMLQWIDANTEVNDVFVSGQPQSLYLYGNRQGLLLRYSNESSVILDQLTESEVAYAIPSVDGEIAGRNQMMGETIDLRAVIEQYPGEFTLVFQSDIDPRFRIYRVNQPNE